MVSMHYACPKHETPHHCEPNMQQTIHRIHLLLILQLFIGTGLITQVAAEQRGREHVMLPRGGPNLDEPAGAALGAEAAQHAARAARAREHRAQRH